VNLRLHTYELPLQHTFTIARGAKTIQKTLIVELQHDNVRGYGEAACNDYYDATIESMSEALDRVRRPLADASPDDPEALLDRLPGLLADHPFARCALDEAAWDLAGKRAGRPVYDLWGLSVEDVAPSSYTIGIDSIEAMIAKLAEQPDWPIYKIKLGADHDIEIVRALRRHTDATFRVDANCGWTAAQTIEHSRDLADLGVEFIEQPLPADDWDGVRQVFAESALPIIADESCVGPDDVDRCAGCFGGVNIKLTKCGGLTPGRRMAARARELGLSVMVGCMTESTVGISAAAQLLPLVDHADLDGAVLLAEDTATGVTVHNGHVTFPDVAGTGVTLLE